MGVKLAAASGGSIELVPTNTASNFTLTVPAGTGTMAVQGVSTNIVSGTAVASTSGTSIDFTSIPDWVKRITVMFSGVSTSGTSLPQVQIGSGSVVTSGYVQNATYMVNAGSNSANGGTTGFILAVSTAASDTLYGTAVITLAGSNRYVSTVNTIRLAGASVVGAGGITLGGVLDRVRITTVNGTDTFDAGSINILYE
jgi:hypothetical protein